MHTKEKLLEAFIDYLKEDSIPPGWLANLFVDIAMAAVGAGAQGTPPRDNPGPQYHTITDDMINVLLQQAPQKLVPFSMAAPNSTAGRYSLFSIAPSGRTLIVTENLPGFQCEFEDDEGVPLVELLALDKEGVLVTRQFSHETVMFGSIFRNQHSLLEPDVVEFLNHKELEKFLPRLVSLQEVKVFRNYGTGNVPVGLPTWGARVPPTASGGPSGIGPPPKPLAMEMVDLSKHSSGGRGQREGSPEVTSPAPLSSKVWYLWVMFSGALQVRKFEAYIQGVIMGISCPNG